MQKNIRWVQRFNNYTKALVNLNDAVELASERELSKLEKQGLIQAFEIVYELSWNTIKDFYKEQGETSIQGSRDAFRLAYSRELIEDGKVFMDAIKSRQLTSHSYNEETAEEIYLAIMNEYSFAFRKLQERLEIEIDKIHG